jgi:predicted transposase YbfD/YdcC
MTKITWLGEDTETHAGPSFVVWNGIRFAKDVAVDVSDEYMIRKAHGNRFFKVSKEASPNEVEAKIEEQNKIEEQTEIEQVRQEADHGKAEGAPGYTPVKKKARKKAKTRSGAAAGIPAADA